MLNSNSRQQLIAHSDKPHSRKSEDIEFSPELQDQKMMAEEQLKTHSGMDSMPQPTSQKNMTSVSSPVTVAAPIQIHPESIVGGISILAIILTPFILRTVARA